MTLDSENYKRWETEHLKENGMDRGLWDAAKKIVHSRSSYIGGGGTMYLNITDVVMQGIQLGIAMGRRMERNEILEIIVPRDGLTK